MAYPLDSCHNQSLQEYANARMDREMATSDMGSRTEDVDLAHSTYELTRDLGNSAFRDKISVLNITDEVLTVLVLPLTYGSETLGGISAWLASSESAQIRWATQEATKRGSAAVYNLKTRDDLVLYDGLSATVSEVLLVITQVNEDAVSVLDARRVSPTENLVLAVLPGLLSEGSGFVPLQAGGLIETIVGEILDRMVETWSLEYDAAAQPPIKVHLTFKGGGRSPGCVKLDAGLGDTMGSIRDRLGAHGVETEQDMYICHNGKLLSDECVLSDLQFWEYRGLSAEQDHLVLSMYLLPGRAQGRLSLIPESGKSFDSASASSLAETEVFFTTWNSMPVLSLKTHPLCNVRHLKLYAIRENIALRVGWYGRFGRDHSDFSISVSLCVFEDESCPLEFFSEDLLLNGPTLCVYPTDGDVKGHSQPPPMYGLSPVATSTVAVCSGGYGVQEGVVIPFHKPFHKQRMEYGVLRRPQWPWKRLHLPLEERDFDGKELNDFDVRTFKKYSSKVVFVNRTSRPVHISCFPTWSKDRRLSSAEISVEVGGVGVGAAGEISTTLKCFQGYGAVDDPCLAPFGASDTVNIAIGMVREMSVVFGVESEDGDHIGYKRLKNVKGGQQVDVLQAFVNKKAKYTHPAGEPSKDALVAHFLPKT